MAIAGTTIVPQSGLSSIVGELVAERMSQLPAYAAAQTAAPIIGRRARNGTYIADTTYRGLDLSAAPTAATAGSLYGTEYPSAGQSFATGTYAVERYLVDQQDVPDAVLEEWAEQAGISMESRVADLLAERVAAVHDYNVWSVLGAQATWASGYKADPGDITSASFSLIALLRTVSEALRLGQKWMPGQPMDVFIAEDTVPYIQLLSEVRARLTSQSATNTIPTPDEIAAFFAAYLPGATVHRVMSNYKSAAGTVTNSLSGAILFQPARPGWARSAVTVAPLGPNTVSVASVRTERVEALPGLRLYADGHMDVKVLDDAGAYLAYSLLS